MGQAPSTTSTTPLNDQLYAAVAEGDTARVKALLQRQTPGQRALLARFANKQGRHVLHKAAVGGHLELVALLLESGAPTDAMNRRPRGGNALHEAAAAGHAHVVRMLLEAGVCPFVQNAVGLTPMDLAMEARHGSALQLLCHAAPWCGQLQVRVSPHNNNCWMKAWGVVAPRLFSQPFGSPAKALSPELLCFGSQGDCCPQFRALLDGCQVVQEEGPDALGAVRLLVLQCKGMRHKYYTTSEGDAVVLHLRPAEQTPDGYASFRRFCSMIRRTHSALFGREGRPLFLPPPPLLGQLSSSTLGEDSLGTAANAGAYAAAIAAVTAGSSAAANTATTAAAADLPAESESLAVIDDNTATSASSIAATRPPVCPIDSAGSLCAPERPLRIAGYSCKQQQQQQEQQRQQGEQEEQQGHGMCCVVCLDAPRSLGLRHGQSVHKAVCYECARRLILSADPLCPLCRRPVEEILAVY